MKENPRRVRFTVGGDKQDSVPENISTKTADLVTAKILFNSVLSTKNSKFMSIDIKDFYLNNEMDNFQYMHIPVHVIPKTIMELYNLQPLVHNGKVYVEIRKGMYGLKEAGAIANQKLVPILAKAGYRQSKHTPGLFKHETKDICFCLVVDDFGVKYTNREDVEHLMKTLTDAQYKITTDWEGKQFCGMQLKWDSTHRTLELSMPGYIEKALQRFAHPPPTKPQDSPYACEPIQYGVKSQLTSPPDLSEPLNKKEIKHLQQVIGVLLYYARAIDNTMLVALGTLAAAQTQGTAETARACAQLLDYAATHPNAAIKFTASDMILHIHSDASYLSEPKARSRAGGYFYLSNRVDPETLHTQKPMHNGAIHIVSSILNNVMASAAEAEVGALFHNAQDACPIRATLEFLGHSQPATPVQTDNA